MTVMLVEIPVQRAGGGEVLRLGSAGYNHPSAPGYYDGPVQRDGASALAPLHTRTAMSNGVSFGAARVAMASLPVANTGDLDWLFDPANPAALEGRPGARVLLGESVDTPYPQFVPVLTGQIDRVEVERHHLLFVFRDPLALLDNPLTEKDYTGANVAPEGVEGTEADLKGKRKPICYGTVKDAPAIAVNVPKNIYQVADKAVSITAVYDKGNAVGVGAVRSSLADLLATNPVAGQFDVYSGVEGSFFRLGFRASGAVSADVTEGATAADRTAGQVWRRILIDRCGVTAAEIAAADVAALDAAAAGEVGLFCGLDGMTRREALDMVAASIGAVYWGDALAHWHIARFAAPAGDPVLTLRAGGPLMVADADIVDLRSVDWPLPAHELKLRWGRCWSPLDRNSMAATVYEDQTARLAFLSQEWRTESKTDAAVKARYPTARSVEFSSLLVDGAAAAAQAGALFDLLSGRLRAWRVSCVATAERAAQVDLLSCVRIFHPRFGLGSGRLFRVIEVAGDRATGNLTLTVVG